MSQKHPHARGEDTVLQIIYIFLLETPPRTWGRREVRHQLTDRVGNTPTHVGKT